MADTKLKQRSPFISAEQVSIGAAAESLAGASATVPGNAGEIWIYVSSGDVHWTPNGTATTTFAHAVAEKNWFMLTHAQQAASIKSDTGSDATVIVVYMRGSRRATAASLTAPY
ncbi:hypothetical protein CMI37_34835 [Candidatus Pacearchaeota archaeon]|nr:hypothetical protein [Candidatus Pacearchaeota archaeon]